MSKDLGTISFLREGILRKKGKHWYVETEQGTVSLDDLLVDYKNKQVRLTCVDMREAEDFSRMLAQIREDSFEG